MYDRLPVHGGSPVLEYLGPEHAFSEKEIKVIKTLKLFDI
jgi:hypothetical protein